MHEPLPPGIHVSIQHEGLLVLGTINNIPFPVSTIIKSAASPLSNQSDDSSQSSKLPESPQYVILLDSGITVKKSYDDLIKAGQDDASPSSSTKNFAALEGIPHFFRHNSRVTMDHKGAFHKGYIHYSQIFGFQFAISRNACYRKIYFTVPLLDFKQN